MQRLEVSGAVRPIHGSLGVKRLISSCANKILVTISVIFTNFFRRKIFSYNDGILGKRNLKIGCVGGYRGTGNIVRKFVEGNKLLD